MTQHQLPNKFEEPMDQNISQEWVFENSNFVLVCDLMLGA